MSWEDIALANTEVSIVDACKLIGMPSMDYQYSIKMYCPFGQVTHGDGGATKSFRVYMESNTAYCFACAERYTPTKLVALEKDISLEEAAQFLLELYKVKPSVDDRWAELTAEKPFALDSADLTESLKVYCRRIDPDWETHQFVPEVAETFQKCLSLIPLIRTEKERDQWREAAKSLMTQRLVNHG